LKNVKQNKKPKTKNQKPKTKNKKKQPKRKNNKMKPRHNTKRWITEIRTALQYADGKACQPYILKGLKELKKTTHTTTLTVNKEWQSLLSSIKKCQAHHKFLLPESTAIIKGELDYNIFLTPLHIQKNKETKKQKIKDKGIKNKKKVLKIKKNI
jgi:hypothetical protein